MANKKADFHLDCETTIDCLSIFRKKIDSILSALRRNNIGFSFDAFNCEIKDVSNLNRALLVVYDAHDKELEILHKELEKMNRRIEYGVIESDNKDKPKVYISGPITGRDLTECKVDFNSAELWLTGLGYDVINPMSYDTIEDGTWEDYMKKDLKMLLDCDYIYMLDGWEKSRGARLEYNVACDVGIELLSLD